ncbi:MAG: RNA polymerase sigma-70 factor [Mameliella sp.]|nr:RNA polymerase sigma-70 factor [Phaeodactylibacter sp.]NRA51057.1 RNA polymerase sigma-70 factor [Phaeodactylibacter sp.]
MQQQPTDKELLDLLNQGDERGIELIFRHYYAYICQAVYKIIPDSNLVEDLAQDVFYELWRKREGLKISTSLKGYLRRAAVNKALNFVRDQRIKFTEEEQAPVQKSTEASAPELMAADQLQSKIDQAIDALPERCRIIFVLSRFEDMSYREIAEHLEISPKTVENQMAKALKLLREMLKVKS